MDRPMDTFMEVCGDEDNGQTSAWYVFSALGFYPVCPGSGEYAVGCPPFDKSVINLENGKKVRITASSLAERLFISHDELLNPHNNGKL